MLSRASKPLPTALLSQMVQYAKNIISWKVVANHIELQRYGTIADTTFFMGDS